MSSANLSVFHEFAPPPTGGGHQFMRALCSELESRGLKLEYNQLSRTTPVCLCNSYNFQVRKLRWALRLRRSVRCVHRVDGPLQTYRGFDDGTDALISRFNRSCADATVVQSRFSLQAHQDLGLSAVQPVLIGNTPDPSIFYPGTAGPPSAGRKLRVIAVSWSDNPNKGLEIYRWLDEHLDFERVEFTFVGRIQADLKRIRKRDPLPSEELADELRRHDVYLTASRNDPCSNSLLEAMACRLPPVYLDSGGHPELAGGAGRGFTRPEEIPDMLEAMRDTWSQQREQIRIPTLAEIADQYMDVLSL